MAAAAVIMAGGRARRLGGVAKPLLRVCGSTILERVAAAALEAARRVAVALSPYTLPAAKPLCPRLPVDACMELPGAGYPADMRLAAEAVRARPLLFLPADTPFLSPRRLRRFVREAVAAAAGLATLEAGGRGPLGVSLLLGGWEPWVTIRQEWGPDLLNVNTPEDLVEAERLCRRLA
ncbi:NTP transferase domain-containing protein [Pyrodictium occultum]|nr:NTP transferase domain-containing protein [Pyrodictium occultum]